MRVLLCADEPYDVHAALRDALAERGHEVVPLGAVADGQEHNWAELGQRAAARVARGDCQMGVLLCWSGTGITMAANKVAGARAALCVDAFAARAARQWNDANLLCLSNRSLAPEVAREILAAWFGSEVLPEARAGLDALRAIDRR